MDVMGDHLCTCTDPLGFMNAHDWVTDQIADLFRTKRKVKTQEVERRRGQRCGDIELDTYITNAAGPVPLVLDLRITHDSLGSSSDPSLNGHLHYPNVTLQSHRQTDRFFSTSGVQLAQSNQLYHFRRAAFSSSSKAKKKNHGSWEKCLRAFFFTPVEGRRDRWTG